MTAADVFAHGSILWGIAQATYDRFQQRRPLVRCAATLQPAGACHAVDSGAGRPILKASTYSR